MDRAQLERIRRYCNLLLALGSDRRGRERAEKAWIERGAGYPPPPRLTVDRNGDGPWALEALMVAELDTMSAEAFERAKKRQRELEHEWRGELRAACEAWLGPEPVGGGDGE